MEYSIFQRKNNLTNIKRNTEKFLYYLLISGGVLSLSIIAPKFPYELLKAYLKNRKFNRGKFNRDLNRLANRGDVRISKDNITITKKGKERVLKYKIDEMEIKKSKKWDGKWRLVVFDIPDYQRNASNTLRHKLLNLGFLQYQKSIFIHPFPCRDEIDFIREIFEVGRCVKFITAVEIDDSEYFVRKFDLI